MRLHTLAAAGTAVLLSSCGLAPTDVAVLQSPERQAARYELLSVPVGCECTRVEASGQVTTYLGPPNGPLTDIDIQLSYLDTNPGLQTFVTILIGGNQIPGLTLTSATFVDGNLIFTGASDLGNYAINYDTDADTFTLNLGTLPYAGEGVSIRDNACSIQV